MRKRRIAIIAEWLDRPGGAERVLAAWLKLYPEADLFALVDFMPEADRGWLGRRTVHTSFLQKLPGARRGFRHFLPLMPLAVEQWDLSAYDLILSSHYAVAKGVITGPDQLHLCYCHSPARFAWDLQAQYLPQGRGWLIRPLLHFFRQWDVASAARPDHYFANSAFIQRRILKTYRRASEVLYPPVDLARLPLQRDKQDYYVSVGRMVPYKRFDLLAATFAQLPDKTLYLIGDGPARRQAEQAAAGAPNIHFLGALPDTDVTRYITNAKAFLFAAEEDFGIAPVEAQAVGTPVIAYAKGGALETLRGQTAPDPTAHFFHEPTVESLLAAIQTFEAMPPISADACRRNAERFAETRFLEEFGQRVETLWVQHSEKLQTGRE